MVAIAYPSAERMNHPSRTNKHHVGGTTTKRVRSEQMVFAVTTNISFPKVKKNAQAEQSFASFRLTPCITVATGSKVNTHTQSALRAWSAIRTNFRAGTPPTLSRSRLPLFSARVLSRWRCQPITSARSTSRPACASMGYIIRSHGKIMLVSAKCRVHQHLQHRRIV